MFSHFRAWFVSSVVSPEFLSIEVDVVLDEDDLFDVPTQSGTHLIQARKLELVDLFEEEDEDEDQITRRIDVRELRRTLEEAGRRRHG
jgi:hypothetical protein